MTEAAASASAADGPAPVPTDVQGATTRRAELLSDPKFRDRVLSGNAEARSELSALNAAIVAGGSAEISLAQASESEHLRSAGVSDEVVQQYLKGEPIAQQERELALQFKRRLLTDKGLQEKLANGDADAIRRRAVCSMLLSLPVKPN